MRELSVAEQRYQAVFAVIADGLSISQVAGKVGVSRQTLHAWLARYEAVLAHLAHYELTAPESDSLRVLGRQRVDPNRPHPFTAAGNTEFNALIWMPPTGWRVGDIVLVDSTNFATLFGGTESLKNLWHNFAAMK
jgi:Homeodomain-like domain